MAYNKCCKTWLQAKDSIKVEVRIQTQPEKYMADTLEKFLKYAMGNYCPMCGNKLQDDD